MKRLMNYKKTFFQSCKGSKESQQKKPDYWERETVYDFPFFGNSFKFSLISKVVKSLSLYVIKNETLDNCGQF